MPRRSPMRRWRSSSRIWSRSSATSPPSRRARSPPPGMPSRRAVVSRRGSARGGPGGKAKERVELAHARHGAVALLVLLARAAGAGVVAADLRLAVDHRLLADVAAGRLFLGRAEGELGGGGRLAAAALLGHLLFGDRLEVEELGHDVVLHPVAHGVEQVVAVLLVFVERIALAVAAEPDAFFEV